MTLENDVGRQDVKSSDDAIFPSRRNDNDEKSVEKPGDETMIVNNETKMPDKTSVDPVCKSTHDDRNLLAESEVPNCKSEGTVLTETYVSQLDSHVKDENEESNCGDKADLVEMSTLSSHLEQIASSADVDNVFGSSLKTDLRGEEDEEMVDDGESSDHFRTRMSLKNPESTNCKESPPVEGSDKEVTSESEKTSRGGRERPSETEPVKDSETLVSERESCKADITASQISEIAQESGRGISGFDLNQDVCSEEVDNPINPVSSTVSVVSASRAVAASGLPASPLQFEGTLGWKGSASTSAFRRIPDSATAHNSSKQRLDCLNIDLNVAEVSDDKIEDFLSRNKMAVISGLPLGEESSVDASPRRPERMQLDLNSIGDEGADWGRDGREGKTVNQNGWQSPSRSSSSSSKHPSLRNIDLNLNDQPVFPYGAFKSSNHEESVISIFGTKLEVKTKDSHPQPSGRILEPPVDFSLGRPGGAGLGLESSINYGNPPFYGHNGFAPGAAMFFYGSPGVPIPYMVDSRGAAVVPQMMGSAQPPSPFIMNMAVAGSSSGSSGPGPTLHNFDLNTGLTIDGGNRDNSGGFRQLFHHNGGSMDEQQYLRANRSFQASSSSTCVVGGKRREPDAARWELFPVNKTHNHHHNHNHHGGRG